MTYLKCCNVHRDEDRSDNDVLTVHLKQIFVHSADINVVSGCNKGSCDHRKISCCIRKANSESSETQQYTFSIIFVKWSHSDVTNNKLKKEF